MYIYIYTYIYIYIYICVCVCVYVYIYVSWVNPINTRVDPTTAAAYTSITTTSTLNMRVTFAPNAIDPPSPP